MRIRSAAAATSALSMALTFASGVSCAAESAVDSYPTRPIRVVVPFAPGGINDVIARILSQKLAENLATTIVIDNRAGAGGTIGSNIVAHAQPDGYTLLFSSSSTIAVSPSLYKNLPYDPIKNFSPITQVASVGSVLVVHPSLPVKTTRDLIAHAKANPGKLNYGSAGPGASQHLATELFKTMAGVDMLHVPFKGGGPALAALIGGQISLMIELTPTALPHIKANRLRAIAVSTPKRSAVLPELPTISEAGLPGYDLTIWVGLLAPGGTPREIVDRLSKAVLASLNDPQMRERLAGQGAEPVGDTPAQFSAYVKSELSRWAAVVKASGARID
jgi:tripartite-type tricarboxylate transporter receptor subunit TctC